MVLIIFPAAFLLLFLIYLPSIIRGERKGERKVTKRENKQVEKKAPKMTKQEFIDAYCKYCGSQMCGGLGSIYACGCKYLANIDVED